MENYKQNYTDLHSNNDHNSPSNDHNSPSKSIDLSDEAVTELKKIVDELRKKTTQQRTEFRDKRDLFLNHGIPVNPVNQTDSDISVNSLTLFQLGMDVNQYEKYLSKKNQHNNLEIDPNS